MRNEYKFITVKQNNMAYIPTELTQEYRPGEIAILDGEFEVTVMGQTPLRLYTTIYYRRKADWAKGLWRVMTYRMSKKQFNFDAGILK